MKRAWPEVALGELTEPVQKRDPEQSGDEYFTYIDLSSVDQIQKRVSQPSILPVKQAPSRARQVVALGDVLVSTVRPNLNAVARVPRHLDGATASTGFTVLRPSEDRLDSRYLAHWVRYPVFVAKMVRLATGASYPAVTDRIVKESTIPLPSVKEQRRIAAILDAADGLRTIRLQSLALLDSLTRSIFLDMFGDPVSNPRGWPNSIVGQMLSSIEYGHRFYNESYSDQGTPVVRITDLDHHGSLSFKDMPRMALTESQRARYALRPGDLLFARSGATVGKVTLIGAHDPECIAGAYFVVLRFVDDVEPPYARALLASQSIQDIVSKTSRQAAQQNFSGPAIKRLPMPVPPRDLQRRFVRHIAKIGHQRMATARSASELDCLFHSIQSRAFSGDL